MSQMLAKLTVTGNEIRLIMRFEKQHNAIWQMITLSIESEC